MYVPSKFFLRKFVSIRSISHHSATAEDITAAFGETVWAYQCVACSGFFLKQSTGMSLWREGARQSAADIVPDAILDRATQTWITRIRNSSRFAHSFFLLGALLLAHMNEWMERV